MKRTKIVATLGPSSLEKGVLEKLLFAGVNVFRVNFSHGEAEENRKTILTVQELLKKTKRHASILADLQGPKLRIGNVEEGAFLNPGDLITFTNKQCVGTKEKVFMTYDSFPTDVNVGETILLDDGKLHLRVVASNLENEVIAETIQGGPLKSKKGVNLPNTRVSLPCLTDKDIYDLNIALDTGVDWVGLSFVRGRQDIKDLKKIITEKK